MSSAQNFEEVYGGLLQRTSQKHLAEQVMSRFCAPDRFAFAVKTGGAGGFTLLSTI